MARLEALRSKQSEVRDAIMQADGFGLWFIWQAELNPVLEQTLEDYGGVKCAAEGAQSLWFFFSPEIFLALARLSVWSRFNQLAVTMQVFPARLRVGQNEKKQLIFDEPFWKQELDVESGFKVWVHPGSAMAARAIPGMSLKKKTLSKGMSDSDWDLLEVDARLPYQPSMGWYAILRPVGNPLDKAFQVGWREFFGQIEPLLQRNKFRFTIHDFFLVFPIESMRLCRSWCNDLLTLIDKLKTDSPQHYWPCVQAIVDRKNLTFSEDLPHKVGLDWEQLSPDYPHMSMRNALFMGDDFKIHEVGFAVRNHDQNDWTNISLNTGEQLIGYTLPQLVPTNLVLGPYRHCFYCGQRSHPTAECPTRSMPEHGRDAWDHLADLDIEEMVKASCEINKRVAEGQSVAGLAQDDSPEGVFYRTLYELNWPVQVRSISTFWRMKNRDPNKAFANLSPENDSPAWGVLHDFSTLDPGDAEKTLHTLLVRFPKDFRLMCLKGFLAIEKGDVGQAISAWKEAELFCNVPFQQGWLMLLQARAIEYDLRLPQAIAQYEQILRILPNWAEAAYRRMVCTVKSGFADKAISVITTMVARDANCFNMILLDTELERGSTQIHTAFSALFENARNRAKEEADSLKAMRAGLDSWFLPAHPFAAQAGGQIERLLHLSEIQNFVAFQKVIRGRALLDQESQSLVKKEAGDFKSKFKEFTEKLRHIHGEAAWFPFPKALGEFNKNYNLAVANLNWALQANLQLPEAFKKAQLLAEQEEARLKKLESRLRFLRIIRDSTLFMLSTLQVFIALVIVGFLCIFVILPLLIMYGDRIGLNWTVSAISENRLYMQKALFFLLCVLAFGVAILRTVIRFESIKAKVFSKAKAKQASKMPSPPQKGPQQTSKTTKR